MDTPSEALLDKIEKLIRLSKSSNGNEAQAALLKAQMLMVEHHISEEDLAEAKAAREEKIIDLAVYTDLYGVYPWRNHLASVLAKNFRCRFFVVNMESVLEEGHLLGYESDVQATHRLLAATLAGVEACVAAYLGEEEEESASDRRYLEQSWKDGFLVGLVLQFELQQAALSARQALMLVTPPAVEQALANRYGMVPSKQVQRTMATPDRRAFGDGVQTGQTWSTEPVLGQ